MHYRSLLVLTSLNLGEVMELTVAYRKTTILYIYYINVTKYVIENA